MERPAISRVRITGKQVLQLGVAEVDGLGDLELAGGDAAWAEARLIVAALERRRDQLTVCETLHRRARGCATDPSTGVRGVSRVRIPLSAELIVTALHSAVMACSPLQRRLGRCPRPDFKRYQTL